MLESSLNLVIQIQLSIAVNKSSFFGNKQTKKARVVHRNTYKDNAKNKTAQNKLQLY